LLFDRDFRVDFPNEPISGTARRNREVLAPSVLYESAKSSIGEGGRNLPREDHGVGSLYTIVANILLVVWNIVEDQGWHGRERVWLQDVKSWNLLDLENDKRNSVSSQVDQSFVSKYFKTPASSCSGLRDGHRSANLDGRDQIRNYYSADPTGH
jgi:hypothetical protein